MIRKVSFKNFYSFKDSQTIDFTANKKSGYDYYNSKSGDQITKIAGFGGGNASGKTNIMRVFSFLRYLVSRGFLNDMNIQQETQSLLAYHSFFNNAENSEIHLEFELNKAIYKYDVTINKSSIIYEKLLIEPLLKWKHNKILFLREENKIVLDKVLFKGINSDLLTKVKDDISLISFLNFNYKTEQLQEVYNFFYNFKTNINEFGIINDVHRQVTILDNYVKDTELKKDMELLIKNFDIGLISFDIIKQELEDKHFRIKVNGLHKTKEKEKSLDFIYESRGTQILFFTLGSILKGLKYNSVIVLDEAETGLHPEALIKILQFFLDENRDSSAQLIFSSHSYGFFNKLDMHQIYLTEKNENGESTCLRLSEIEGIRTDENFLSKYMAGKYGSFPNIKI